MEIVYGEGYSLSGRAAEDVMESIISTSSTEIGEGAIGRPRDEIKAAKEAKPGFRLRGIHGDSSVKGSLPVSKPVRGRIFVGIG